MVGFYVGDQGVFSLTLPLISHMDQDIETSEIFIARDESV